MKPTLSLNSFFIVLLMALSSCGQTFNSNTSDTGLIPFAACGAGNSDEYCAAEVIIRDKCINCHSGYHDQWASYKTDADWLGSGRVVAGSTAGSTLITRLKNQGGNMPADAPQISDADYQTLITWVQSL